jgi:glycosyltransferase involved in cell wall biosynthesis
MSISVIIPAYNRADLLAATLRSLLHQTLPADEIIVVDDGSTDHTAAVAESFGAPVRVIKQDNAGPAGARNRGWKESVGDFLHFFDSDDIAMPNKHEVQLAALVQSGADVAYSPWIKGTFSGTRFQPQDHMLQQKGLPEGDMVKALLTDWSIVPHVCMFRRSIVETIGGFPEDLFGTEDQMMFLNCLLHGGKIVHTPDTFELYRVGTANKITESKDGSISRIREWAKFLISAHEACVKRDIDPKSWYGFRRRAWEAVDDMHLLGMSEPNLKRQLEVICRTSAPDLFYRLERLLERKKAGLRRRLTGGSAHRSFNAGPLTSDHKRFIAEWLEVLDRFADCSSLRTRR